MAEAEVKITASEAVRSPLRHCHASADHCLHCRLKSVEVAHTRVHRGSKANCLGNIHGVSDDRSIVDNQRGRKPNCRIRGKRTDSVHANVSSATWVSGSSILALRR